MQKSQPRCMIISVDCASEQAGFAVRGARDIIIDDRLTFPSSSTRTLTNRHPTGKLPHSLRNGSGERLRSGSQGKAVFPVLYTHSQQRPWL